MADILFKGENAEQQDEFQVSDLFQSSIISSSLHRLVPPSALNLTPDELYQEIRNIAQIRFGFSIPEDLKEFACLQSINYKTSLLRDLCKCIGVQLLDEEKREYLLGNSIEQITAHYKTA